MDHGHHHGPLHHVQRHAVVRTGTLSRLKGAERRVSWYVYIVRCADRTLYTGVAKDLPQRIAAHNGGRGAKYTRQRLPVKLVYSESAADRGAAQRREYAIRRLSRAAKSALCSKSAVS